MLSYDVVCCHMLSYVVVCLSYVVVCCGMLSYVIVYYPCNSNLITSPAGPPLKRLRRLSDGDEGGGGDVSSVTGDGDVDSVDRVELSAATAAAYYTATGGGGQGNAWHQDLDQGRIRADTRGWIRVNYGKSWHQNLDQGRRSPGTRTWITVN